MKKITNFYNKHQEFIKYGIFGLITTLFHIGLFYVLIKLGLKYYISNIITLITIKSLAYIVNKIFVFKTKCKNKKELSIEIFKYVITRLFTMIIDYFGLILLVEKFGINELASKVLVLILVVIINYILCKKYVYKNGDEKMDKFANFLKKHWFIISILILSIIRFLFTYKLPNFYLHGLNYDDGLMVKQSISLENGVYLGLYTPKTLIKGMVFPYLLYILRLYHFSLSSFLSFMYVIVNIYFIYSLKNIVKNKKYLLLIFTALLFNPASYSQDLFQRLYRNSLSMIELLFFLGSLINVLYSPHKKAYNFILYGVSISLLFLTREDNLWIYPAIIFVIIFNIIRNKKIKNVILNLLPILILTININIVSYVNYKHYGIYTSNEIHNSNFHNTYKKILQIKDSNKKNQVSVTKETFYALALNSKKFGLTKADIDRFYNRYAGEDGQIYNGNIVWYLRSMVNRKYKFKSGKESEKYYKELGIEIDELFKKKKLEKEFTLPSISFVTPTYSELKKLPSTVAEAIIYTTSYKNIKTLTDVSHYKYNEHNKAYYFGYRDYHHTVNIVKKNELKYEIIRAIYAYATIILSIIAYLIYLFNTNKKDGIAVISHLLFLFYILIIGGISYTHITAFHAIRPLYLGNIYIIQSIFIFINLYRIKDIKIKIKK